MQNVKLQSKIQNFKFLFVIFLFSFFIFHLASRAVFGQTLSFGIWPPLLEVMIQPGKSITQVYKLTNSGETDLAFTSKIVPFEPADEKGNIDLDDLDTPGVDVGRHTGSASFFSFQNADLALGQKFFLPAGKTQEIVLKIKIPENAKEDDYYLTLLFQSTPGVDLSRHSGSGAEAQAKIGSNILLTVSQTGEPTPKAEISEFSIRNSQFAIRNRIIIDSFTNPQFLIRLKNTGKTFFKPFGTITTRGWFGQKFILDLLPENVLVNSIRQIQCQADDRVAPCQLKTRFFLGPYRAKVEFGLDKPGEEYMAETIFWAIPVKLLLGVLTALLILCIVKSKPKFPLDN